MSNLTLLRNGKAYFNGRCEPADILIEGDRIARVTRAMACPEAAAAFDASGLLICPGFVDLHTHLREPGFSAKETAKTGTQAAAAGGFTTVCAMPNVSPVPDTLPSLAHALDILARGARVEARCYGAITREQKGQALADIEAMAPHVVGFSDDGKGVMDAQLMESAMRKIAAVGGLLAAHCEDESQRLPGGCVHDGDAARRFGVVGIPSKSEWAQVARDLALVKKTGVRYHVCHVSSKESVELIRRAKADGLPVTCECTPHQLALCDADIAEDSGRFKMNPPLRAQADRQAIIAGLLDGTIDAIATDHAPHTAEEKARGLSGSAFGIVGLETAFAVCHTALVLSGLCDLPFLLGKLTAAPARILGQEAALREGAPANLVALDLKQSWRVDPSAFASLGRSTPFDGRTLTGRPVATWYRGHAVYGIRG